MLLLRKLDVTDKSRPRGIQIFLLYLLIALVNLMFVAFLYGQKLLSSCEVFKGCYYNLIFCLILQVR